MGKGGFAWFSVTHGGKSVELALHIAVKAGADRGANASDVKCQNFICARYRERCEERYGQKPRYVMYGDLDITEQRSATEEEAGPWAPPSPAQPEWGDLFDLSP